MTMAGAAVAAGTAVMRVHIVSRCGLVPNTHTHTYTYSASHHKSPKFQTAVAKICRKISIVLPSLAESAV